LQLIYRIQEISINNPLLTIIRYIGHIMVESDNKATLKADDISAEKKAEPSVKKDSSKAV